MGDLPELAKGLLETLQTCHEEADTKAPQIYHFLRKVSDGRIKITEEEKEQCNQIFKQVGSTLTELTSALHKLARLTNDGLQIIEKAEVTSHSLMDLKQDSLEDEKDSLKPQLRAQKSRVVLPDSGYIGSIDSSLLPRSESDDARPLSAFAVEHLDESEAEPKFSRVPETTPSPKDSSKEHETPHAWNNLSGENQPALGMDFANLSVSSFESNILNEETGIDRGIEPGSDRSNERDSVAFDKTIENPDRTFLNAQGQAVHDETRNPNRKDGSVLHMEEDYYSEKEYDA